MKLRVAVNAIRLGLAAPVKRLGVAANAILLVLAVPAIRLQTAVGKFMEFLRLSDTVSSTSSIVTDFGKALDDAVAAALTTVEFEVRKALTDGAGADDGEQYFAEDYVDGAPLGQTYTLPPQLIRDMTTVYADTAQATASGLLVIQDYTVDYTYFAEDYVGLSRSF